MKLAVLLFWGIIHSIFAFNFEDPLQNGVTWLPDTCTAAGQIVYLDESNEGGRIRFARIVQVFGELIFFAIVSPTFQSMLDVQIETDAYDSTHYYLSANRLDFEALREGGFTTDDIAIEVFEDGDLQTRQTLILNIQDLDDEAPTLTVLSTCSMEENTRIDIDTSTCVFQISDPDGRLNQMDYSTITGPNGVEDLFEFKHLADPGDNIHTAHVFLVLQPGQFLDYEKTTLYTFLLEAKDGAGHSTVPSASIPILVEVLDLQD